MKTTQNKELLLTQLRKVPIVQLACEKAGVGRATYYYWRKKSKKFASECDKAIEDGIKVMNDMAESQMLTAIRSGNMTAVGMWLRHHHPSYENKVKVDGNIKYESEKLSPDQEKLVAKALNSVGLLSEDIMNNQGENDER